MSTKAMPLLETKANYDGTHSLWLTRYENDPIQVVESKLVATYGTEREAQTMLSLIWRGMCDAHQRGYEAAHAERDRLEGI